MSARKKKGAPPGRPDGLSPIEAERQTDEVVVLAQPNGDAGGVTVTVPVGSRIILPAKDLNDLVRRDTLYPGPGEPARTEDGKAVWVTGEPKKRIIRTTKLDPAEIVEALQLYSYSGKDTFFQKIENKQGRPEWIQFGIETLRMILRAEATDGPSMAKFEEDAVIVYLHRHRQIHVRLNAYAGWPMGVHDHVDGRRILVMTEKKVTSPVKGNWKLVGECLDCKLGPDQKDFWLTQHHIARKCYREDTLGNWTPTQAMLVLGETGTGKNFFTLQVSTPLLGRMGDASEWMSSQDKTFNADWFGCEHIVICDPVGDHRSKKVFGAKLKSLVANEFQRLHPKGVDAILLFPKFIVSITCNLNQSSRAILPHVLASDIRDKLLVLRWSSDRGPFPMRHSERAPFFKQIMSELPALAYHLDHEYEIPERIASRTGRYAMDGYCEPSLAELFLDALPSHELLLMMRQARQGEDRIWDQPGDVPSHIAKPASDNEWLATHAHVRAWLEASDISAQAVRFFKSHENVGHLLSGIEDVFEDLCRPHRHRELRYWRFSKGALES